MKILVVTSSRHGATDEVGDRIVDVLRSAGHLSRRVAPSSTVSLDGVDAVVVGSAVYMTQWMESMRAFVTGRADVLRALPVWVFSVGLAGVPHGEVQDPMRAARFISALDPIDYRTFRGRLDPSLLGLRERSVIRMAGGMEGDYREWDKIEAFAGEIAAQLTEHAGA
ncbi:flavodoxin domain-containing protein [Georgenia sp. Z1491]|uniref:flavodoxin domain-containing protein n=1 Tax=Georgenia sp. Z1491 TaxID=3416707 RepID=UPI003CEFF754